MDYVYYFITSPYMKVIGIALTVFVIWWLTEHKNEGEPW